MHNTPSSPGAARTGAGRAPASTLRDAEHVNALLARIRLDESSLDGVLQQVVDLARATIPAADAVSVTLVDGDGPRTAASTGALALELDQHQYALGEGPCLDAVRERRAVTLLDLVGEEVYPGFLPRAREAGVRAIASVALAEVPRSVMGLNVYTRQQAEDPRGMAAGAQDLAEAAAATAANAALLTSATRVAEELRSAMATRAVIEQAKGLLVARLGCTLERAFDLLAEQSQHTNRKLRDIAVELVQEAQGLRRPPRPNG